MDTQQAHGKMDIGVVHLVWVPYGVQLLERFLASYQRYQAGVDHELTVIFNGYQSREDLAPFEAALRSIEHTPLYYEAPQQDIASYFAAAQQLSHRYLCFVNSYSQIQDHDWLHKLYRHLVLPGVGLVGATGSWQRAYYPPFTRADYMGYFPERGLLLRPAEYIAWLRGWVQFYRKRQSMARYFKPYPRFPNPHIRTTGFMIERARMLKLYRSPIITKEDALLFESGRQGLSYRIRKERLKTLVIGKDDRAYEPQDWHLSHTYRQGAQSNLLITDNRTGQYADGDLKTRQELSRWSWGEKAQATTDPLPVNAEQPGYKVTA